jgi:hypothetical protein
MHKQPREIALNADDVMATPQIIATRFFTLNLFISNEISVAAVNFTTKHCSCEIRFKLVENEAWI